MPDSGWWLSDLVLALVLTAAGGLAVVLQPGGLLQIALALPLLVLLPGYAFVSVLFPESKTSAEVPPFDTEDRGLGTGRGVEIASPGVVGRLGLAVISSFGIVSLVALVTNFSLAGLSRVSILGGVTAITAGLLLIAAARRHSHPSAERFSVSLRPTNGLRWSDSNHRFQSTPWAVTVPNVVLLLGVLLLASSVGYAAVADPIGSQHTAFRVETENMTGETRTLYPSSFSRGSSTPLDVIVTNHEGERTNYTVVTVLQRIDTAREDVTVRDAAVLGRHDTSVPNGASRRVTLEIQPTMSGDDLRLVLLLYRSGAPANLGQETAYRSVRLHVTVDAGETQQRVSPPNPVRGSR